MSDFNEFDILSVSERAKRKIEKGEYVVNGSSGTLYYENGEIVSYSEANRYLIENFLKFLSYSSQLGSKEYREGYLNWLFEDKLPLLKERKNIAFCASSGGTEALFIAFKTLAKDHVCLFPSIRWVNYDTICEETNIEFELFNFFNKDSEFDFNSLEEKINSVNSKILLVINDPCHNPTGFNFKSDDYDKLFSLINKYDKKITLLLDLAYLDYSFSRNMIIGKIINSNFKNPLYLAVSASKSFGYYGLRMGALINIFPKEEKDIYSSSYKKIIRGTISSTNHLASGGLSLFFNNKNDVLKVKEEIISQTNRLVHLGNEVKKILDEKGIKYYPYDSGFYITVIKNNAKEYLRYLESKNIFFTLNDENSIRIALSSLKEKDLAYIKENL